MNHDLKKQGLSPTQRPLGNSASAVAPSSVDDRLVWGVLEGQLPSLQRCVDELLDGGNEPGSG